MMPSSHQPAEVASRGRRVFCAVVLLSMLGVTLFLAIRHRAPRTPLLPEVHRTKLELRVEGWYAPGEPRGFTGFLLDTYDHGALKWRSAVSNGLLHGLSQGWYTNGQQQVEEHFVAGTSHGWRTKWPEALRGRYR